MAYGFGSSLDDLGLGSFRIRNFFEQFFEQFFERYRATSTLLPRRDTSPVAARLGCEECGRECIRLFWAADGTQRIS